MSGAEEDERDLLAGEYVLGCLEAAEMRRVEAMAATDGALRAAIAAWAERLAPLGELPRPVNPPAALWQRLETTIGGGNVVTLRPSVWRSPRLWRTTTAAALAMAAVFAGIAFFSPPPPVYVAALAPLSGTPPAFLARTEADGSLLITAVSPAPVATDRALELWALPAGAQPPISLGLLPPGGRRVARSEFAQPRTQILVSLEPAGGSPTGQPTGPVLYGGTLD